MLINNAVPYFNTPQINAGGIPSPVSAQPEKMSYYSPGVIVEISQQAKDAYNKSALNATGEVQKISSAQEIEGCQTCKNRKYVDESNDPSVSYQTPTHISPEQSAGKVMSHEREHVSNEQSKAQQKDRVVVSQTVSLSTAICPECGKMYISGGVTRTVTADSNKPEPQTGNNDSVNSYGDST